MTQPSRAAAAQSIFTVMLVQAVVTGLFALTLDLRVKPHPVIVGEVTAAVLCLAVGLVLRSRQTSATWMFAIGFEIAFAVFGIGMLITSQVYVVGSIIALFNVIRLNQLRAVMTGPQTKAGH